jgi:predicted transcriptional regulator
VIETKKNRRRRLKDAAISFEIESAHKRKLEQIARAEDRSLAHVLREAVRRFIESREQVPA